MSRSKKKSGKGGGGRSAPLSAASAAKPARYSFRGANYGWWLALGVAVAATIAAGIYLIHAPRTPSTTLSDARPGNAQPQSHAAYVGAPACKQCHESEYRAWTGSHHQLAMQEASASTVLGKFDDAKFRYGGVESTFFKLDGKFMVRTDDADGRLADFEVKYAFGVTPLQQYLIEFPGGRYQALSIAWDTGPKSEGGQRWFHLYPNEKIDHKDQLHWAGLYQNWNLQCAACHSTNLKKGYDASSNTYKTTFSDINVACEACHGAGSGHVDWARKKKSPYTLQDGKGFAAPMQSRWNDWKFPANDAKYAQRDKFADPAAMNACGPCHSRRSTIAEGGHPGTALEDTHRLALLTQPNYHADGQQRDEVYTWGSFLQSKMHQRGVTCMDCHEPHVLKLRAQGNALCTRCHNAAVFDTQTHHFHKAGTKAAQCAECHMPAQNYMLIDARRDHGIRVPRPDLSISLGSPNACTQCHADRKPDWAAVAMDQWYGKTWRERPHFGTTLHAGMTQGPKALPSLLALADGPATPSIVGATAVALAQPYVRPGNLPEVRKLLAHVAPEMRIAALGLLEPFEPVVRAQAGAPLLADPVRGVRIEAARVLADVADDQIPSEQRSLREKATAEFVESLQQESDWPAANVNLGNLRMRQGRPEEAIAAYERALSLDTRFIGAYVNLADAYRQIGREPEGESVLKRGIALLPRAADLHHALGLLLVRKADKILALRELRAAVKLAPDSARYAYVYAIGLHSTGKREAALAELRTASARHPYDTDILSALVSMNREAGNAQAALPYARRIAEIFPGDPGVQRLLADLEGAK